MFGSCIFVESSPANRTFNHARLLVLLQHFLFFNSCFGRRSSSRLSQHLSEFHRLHRPLLSLISLLLFLLFYLLVSHLFELYSIILSSLLEGVEDFLLFLKYFHAVLLVFDECWLHELSPTTLGALIFLHLAVHLCLLHDQVIVILIDRRMLLSRDYFFSFHVFHFSLHWLLFFLVLWRFHSFWLWFLIFRLSFGGVSGVLGIVLNIIVARLGELLCFSLNWSSIRLILIWIGTGSCFLIWLCLKLLTIISVLRGFYFGLRSNTLLLGILFVNQREFANVRINTP